MNLSTEKTKKRRRGRTITSIDKRDMHTAYLMILPVFVLLTIFVIVPLIYALERSFFDWNFYIDSEFVGFDNYRIIVNTVYFQQALRNIIRLTAIIVPISLLISFLFANALTRINQKLSTFTRVITYIPGIVSGIVISVIFSFLLDYRGGVINQVLMWFGEDRIAFLNSPFTANLVVVIATLWAGFGGNVLLMYLGLMNIPNEYYEAAQIDGAGAWAQMRYITLPQMKNIIVLMTVNMTTGTLQMFDIPYMLTGGGPTNTTLTPMLYLYNNYRDMSKGMGFTIAGAVLMLIFITAINSLVIFVLKPGRDVNK